MKYFNLVLCFFCFSCSGSFRLSEDQHSSLESVREAIELSVQALDEIEPIIIDQPNGRESLLMTRAALNLGLSILGSVDELSVNSTDWYKFGIMAIKGLKSVVEVISVAGVDIPSSVCLALSALEVLLEGLETAT